MTLEADLLKNFLSQSSPDFATAFQRLLTCCGGFVTSYFAPIKSTVNLPDISSLVSTATKKSGVEKADPPTSLSEFTTIFAKGFVGMFEAISINVGDKKLPSLPTASIEPMIEAVTKSLKAVMPTVPPIPGVPGMPTIPGTAAEAATMLSGAISSPVSKFIKI